MGYTTLLKDCGRGEGLAITTCLESVVCGEQGHAPCKVWFVVSKVMLPVKCGLW